ncbi:MAG: hypothetical protein ABR521_12310 [Gaiellaceae bacterium]
MRRRRSREAAWALAAAAVALVAAAGALRIWHATPGQPLAYSGDARLYAAVVVSGTLEDGWYLENERLAAPLGQRMHDYPFENGALLDLAAVALIGLVAGETFATMNAFFLLTFPAVALAAFLVLRRLRLSRPSALVCSVLFALLPYHFYRGEAHLFLSAYYAVPVGVYLVLRVLAGRPLVTREPRRIVTTLALAALVATGGAYYAGFTLALLVLAALMAAVGRRQLGPLLQALVPATGILVVLLLEHLPALVHRLGTEGSSAATRRPVETEIFSLKLADLVLPLDTHRLSFLGDVTRRYRDETVLPSESGATLGTLGTLGFVFLLGLVVTAALGRSRLRRRRPLLGAAAVTAVLAFVLATTGGLATLLAYTATPQLRAWSRVSIVIGFVALFALGVGLDRLRALVRARGYPPALATGLLVAVLGLGLADQTSDAFIPNYRGVADEFTRDRTFFRAVEERVPRGAALFQLPHLPFPESSDLVPPRMAVYDQLAGSLHSKRLRWSFGAVKGGPEDWASLLARRPLPHVLPAVASAGFAGIEVDRRGYADDGAALEDELRRRLRVPPLEGPGGRRAFYDLRPFARRVEGELPPALLEELRTATLRPPRLLWGDEFHREDVVGKVRLRRARRARGALLLENRTTTSQRVVVSFGVVTIGRPAAVRLQWPDGRRQSRVVGSQKVSVRRTLSLPPGTSRILFETDPESAIPDAGDRRRGSHVRFVDPDLAPTVLERAAGRLAGL